MCDLCGLDDTFSLAVVEFANAMGLKERVYGKPAPPCDFRTILYPK